VVIFREDFLPKLVASRNRVLNREACEAIESAIERTELVDEVLLAERVEKRLEGIVKLIES